MKTNKTGEFTQMIKYQNCSDKWKVHIINLLREMVINNEGMGIFKQPINITGNILYELGDRCAKINDPILNSLMCRLTIYEEADPCIEGYDSKKVRAIINFDHKKAESNLRLIQEAPALLQALKECRQAMIDCGHFTAESIQIKAIDLQIEKATKL